jgi:hypothetical protein
MISRIGRRVIANPISARIPTKPTPAASTNLLLRAADRHTAARVAVVQRTKFSRGIAARTTAVRNEAANINARRQSR